jgi:hypothetical protein
MFRRSFIIRSTGSVLAAIALAACDSQEPTAATKPPVDVRVGTEPLAAAAPKPSAYEIVQHVSSVVSGNTGIVEVLCPSVKKAMGGGFFIDGGILIEGADVAVYESSPRVTSGGNGASGWRLVAANRTAESRNFNVYAICATI